MNVKISSGNSKWEQSRVSHYQPVLLAAKIASAVRSATPSG